MRRECNHVRAQSFCRERICPRRLRRVHQKRNPVRVCNSRNLCNRLNRSGNIRDMRADNQLCILADCFSNLRSRNASLPVCRNNGVISVMMHRTQDAVMLHLRQDAMPSVCQHSADCHIERHAGILAENKPLRIFHVQKLAEQLRSV